jgi:hypothetical protein
MKGVVAMFTQADAMNMGLSHATYSDLSAYTG